MKTYLMKRLIMVSVVIFCIFSFCGQPVLAQDKYGGIIKQAVVRNPVRFGDPLNVRGQDGSYAQAVMQRLMEADGKGGYESVLAESWDLASDGSAYTIKLRKGVKYHDGTDFNAQAVKFNLQRGISSPISFLDQVKSMDVVDNHTLRLNLKYWDNLILPSLSSTRYAWMTSPTAFEKKGKKWIDTHPVGTGAFKLKSFKRDNRLSYEKFGDYWEKGLPYADEFHFILMPDPMTSMAAMLKEEVHLVQSVPTEIANQMLEKPQFSAASTTSPNLGLFPKTNDPSGLWHDKRLRYALEYAIDKEKINETLGLGYTKVLYTVTHMNNTHPSVPNRTYNPQKAKELLAEAGYPNGFKTGMIMVDAYPKTVAAAIQAYLAEVGIEMDIKVVTRAAFQPYKYEGGAEDNFVWEPYGVESPMIFGTHNYWGKGSGNAVETARPPGFDDALKKAIRADSPEEQKRWLQEMETIGYKEAMIIPLWTRSNINVFNKDILKDAKMFIHGTQRSDFSRAWLTRK